MTDSIQRKTFTELPELAELKIILKREAQRPIATGKENQHFASFVTVVDRLNALGINPKFFHKIYSQEQILTNEAFKEAQELKSLVVQKTLDGQKGSNRQLITTLEEVTAYLGEEDKPEAADVIFVFGSKNIARIAKAVEFYKNGLGRLIFITGGSPVYTNQEKSEAVAFKEFAVAQGVPESAVQIHDGAISVADNVRGGLNKLDELGIAFQNMVLITAWFAQRRSWAHMMKYVPRETKLFRVNAAVTPTGDFTEEGWYKNERGIAVIFDEFLKMKISEGLNTS
jgi:hypothetical protein